MGLGLKYIVMEVNIKESIKMELNMDWGCIIGKMGLVTRGNGN
jgi:hypothetical protein